MSESHARWIETAVRPLADNPDLQRAAANLLEDAAANARGNAGAALARWEEVDARPRRPWVKWALFAVLAGVSAWAWAEGVKDFREYWLSQIRVLSCDEAGSRQMLSRQLNARGRLLLLGDVTQNTRSERMQGLWDSAPDNPAYFMEYAGAYAKDHEQLPPGYLETARRLDPANSWFSYFAAAVNLKGVVEANKQNKGDREIGAAKAWTICEQQKLDDSITLLHQASGQARFDSYQTRMLRERMPFIPHADLAEYVVSCFAAIGTLPELMLRDLSKGIAAKSWQCSEQGDREGFLRLLADVDALNTHWADSEPGNIVGELVFMDCLSTTLPNLRAAAEKFELTEQAKRLKVLEQRCKQRKQARKDREKSRVAERVEARASALLSPALFYRVQSPPPLTDADLKPGRLMEHAILARGCCLAAWVVFGVSLGLVVLFRFRLPRPLGRLAPRLAGLLRPSDFAWLLGAGLLLPYAYAMGINRFTPLGGREFGITGNSGLLPMAQFFGMAVLMLVVPVLIARWRLGRRAGIFGLGGGRSWLGWSAVLGAAVGIPLSGWIAPAESHRDAWQPLLLGLAALSVLWLIAVSLRALFGSDRLRLLSRGAIACALVPVYAVAMLLMAVAAPCHKAAERYWFQRDMLLRMEPAFPAMSPFESKVTRQIRRETRALLGLERGF